MAGEEQEGLGDDAGPHVGDELQADGAAALHTLRLVQAQVAAAAVGLGTRVGAWRRRSWRRRRRRQSSCSSLDIEGSRQH